MSIGKGAEGEDGIEVTPVPIDPVPVGPAVGPRGDVSLVIGYGGVDNDVSGTPVIKGAVPVGPAVGPVEEVSLLRGYGGEEEGTSVGTEGKPPVPMGPVTRGAVPVGPTADEVVLPMGKGAEGVGSLKVTPGPVPVPEDVIAVGPSVGAEVVVLLSIGNGGEGEIRSEDDPVPLGAVICPFVPVVQGGKLKVVQGPVGGMTVNVESMMEEEDDDEADEVDEAIGAEAEVGGGPGTVRFGREVNTELDEEELGGSVGMLGDGCTSMEDEVSGTDAVSVGVQPAVV